MVHHLRVKFVSRQSVDPDMFYNAIVLQSLNSLVLLSTSCVDPRPDHMNNSEQLALVPFSSELETSEFGEYHKRVVALVPARPEQNLAQLQRFPKGHV